MASTYDESTKLWSGPSLPYSFSTDYYFSDFMFEKFDADPKRALQVSVDDGTELTSEELKLSSIRVAQNLIKSGVKPNDVITMITHQSHMTTSLINGVIFSGALINPLDAQFDEKDIRAVCENTKPRIIICDPEAIPKVQKSLNGVNFIYRIYTTSSDESAKYLRAVDLLKPTNEEEKFLPLKFEETSDEKVLAILCTSGSTGSPKGTKLSHKYFLNVLSLLTLSKETAKSACLSPLYWSTGFYPNILFTTNNVRVFSKELFSVEMVIKLVEEFEITSLVMPPSHLIMLLDSHEFLTSNNKSLQNFMASGSILSNVVRKKFESIFPDRQMAVSYGMTEVGISFTKPDEYKIEGAVGSIIFPNTQVKIIDEEGNALEKGNPGEVCAKISCKFLGYYGNEEATKNALDTDGFIMTGDIGFFNDEGVLCIVDRKKEIFKYRGFHVNPSEIENLIYSIQGVKLVTVVALHDLYRTSLAAAAIVKTSNSPLTTEEVVEFVASHFPAYKHLHGGAFFFDELPMTPNGKILKREAKERILKVIEQK